MDTRSNSLRDLALIVIFAAIIAVCAILPAIKTGGLVPITLQTFGVLLAGAVLGPKRGFLAVALYLLVGAVGLPVFSGGGAGPGVLVGPTSGYLLGFPLAAALCGFLVSLVRTSRPALHVALVFAAGLSSSAVFIHTLGMTGLVLRADYSWAAAWATDVIFWPGDVIKNVVMAFVAVSVHRAFPDLRPTRRTPAAAPPQERETIDA
ncbi:biotin transporter BioY [Nocardioides sp. Y6]|uniref:Biotin transporter n=1 Tax=Nocardioides malaquae TaxID=2773426 RepID=A0ABR9RPA3_9ACTN|nr:biotin transporter BioY [Nocardioides malaquae]MBE7323406.1 biotin transporter BioY [Nocardioides malaquae]